MCGVRSQQKKRDGEKKQKSRPRRAKVQNHEPNNQQLPENVYLVRFMWLALK